MIDTKDVDIDFSENIFKLNFTSPSNGFIVKVESPTHDTAPYVKSLLINNVQYCNEPIIDPLDKYFRSIRKTRAAVQDDSCGRRHVNGELIANSPTRGDWPWHAALYKIDIARIRYICGGTLISQNVVLTAAHCVTHRGAKIAPISINVALGKFNLLAGDETQLTSVEEINVYEKFNSTTLQNDIALLKLTEPANFNEYVQPACLWRDEYEKKLNQPIEGMAVGWGLDQKHQLSLDLKQDNLPKISDIKCVLRKPLFYGIVLNGFNFCAGRDNGTLMCNGDAGGGYHVFIPDEPNNPASSLGRWYVHGIISTSVVLPNEPYCDPSQYVIFTDVGKFSEWIIKNLK